MHANNMVNFPSCAGYSNGQAFTFNAQIQNNRMGLAYDGTNVRVASTALCQLLHTSIAKTP